jgi:hypothetical protein
MRYFGHIVFILWLVGLTGGCRQPSPVELTDQQDDSGLITVASVNTSSDSLLVRSGVDSGGLASGSYFGRLVLSAIRSDYPLKKDSSLRSEAIFLDPSHPILRNNRVVAYPSVNIGKLVLNSDTLLSVDRHLSPSFGDTLVGPEYQSRHPYADPTGMTFHWTNSGSGSFPGFDLQAPSVLPIRVTSLSPAYFSPGRPLKIRWNCANPVVNITISRDAGTAQRSIVPVVQFRVLNRKGEVTVPEKILEILPMNRYKWFLLTVSSDNVVPAAVQGYSHDVLIQSSSIHNILLNVRP